MLGRTRPKRGIRARSAAVVNAVASRKVTFVNADISRLTVVNADISRKEEEEGEEEGGAHAGGPENYLRPGLS